MGGRDMVSGLLDGTLCHKGSCGFSLDDRSSRHAGGFTYEGNGGLRATPDKRQRCRDQRQAD
jgi:hypothetical protein